VTGPAVPPGAEDRELLAHAIWTTGRTRAVDRFPLADALMPVVEAIARRRAAEELRAAAGRLHDLAVGAIGPWNPNGVWMWLRDRADALADREETL
jgi:hypothetical protein